MKQLKENGLDEDKPVICPLCGKHYKSKKQLSDHESTVHKFKQCSCNVCGKTFERRKLLINHMDNHKTKKCPSCDRNFKTSTYYKHIHSCKIYNCTTCDFETKRKPELKKHNRLMHNIRKGTQCTQCDYVSPCTSNMKRHIHFVHGNKYGCNECGKQIHFEFMEKHKERHKKIECNICGKFFQPSKIEKHKMAHSVEKVVVKKEHYCDHCTYKSCRKLDLRRHIVKKHVIPPESKQGTERKKRCETCNYTFTRSNYLATHIKNGCQGGSILVFF